VNNGWIGGDGGLLRKTTDAGLTWVVMNTSTVGQQFGSANIKTIHFTDVNNGWIGGDGGLLRKTTDGGLTWVVMNTSTVGQQFGSANIKTIDFTDVNNGWIGGDGGLLRKTTDGGLTWTVMNTSTVGQQFGSANIKGINFIKEITTQVSEEKLNQIALYPNPASTFFTLNNVLEGTTVNVIDVTGKVVVSNSVIDADKTMTIETSNLSNGVYMIQLKNNGAVAHKKLVISK
jgi:hypothetical protein